MTVKLVTPPHRENLDWYRVKYRLASTLVNDAYVRKSSFKPAAKEVDGLLGQTWEMLAPDRSLKRWKRARLRQFLRETVEPAAFSLKASADLGVNGLKPGAAEGLDLDTVRKRLQAGDFVPPQTIVDAILESEKEPRAPLLFDLACFFHLAGDDEKALRYAEAAFRDLPEAARARTRARAAADPMLGAIPGLSTEVGGKARRCRLIPWSKPEKEPERAARPWV